MVAPLDVSETQLVNLKELRDFGPHTPYNLASDLLLLRAGLLDANEPKPDYVQYVIDYIQQAYMLPITVGSLAKEYNVARQYLTRYFKKHTGKTIQEYIMEIRLFEAKKCLLDGHSVKEACTLCGFRDTSNFHKAFKQYNDGMTPLEWKQSHERRTAEKIKERSKD